MNDLVLLGSDWLGIADDGALMIADNPCLCCGIVPDETLTCIEALQELPLQLRWEVCGLDAFFVRRPGVTVCCELPDCVTTGSVPGRPWTAITPACPDVPSISEVLTVHVEVLCVDPPLRCASQGEIEVMATCTIASESPPPFGTQVLCQADSNEFSCWTRAQEAAGIPISAWVRSWTFTSWTNRVTGFGTCLPVFSTITASPVPL